MERQRKIDIVALIVILFLFGAIAYFMYSKNLISDPEIIIDFIEGFGVWSYLVFALFIILEVVVAPIPGSILYTVGGVLFGPLVGGTISLLANIVGATIAFYIGGRIILDKEARKKEDRLNEMINKHGGYSIFLLRINPITSSDIFSFLAGFLRMSYKKFIIGTTLALAPLVYLQSYIGQEIFARNKTIFSVLLVVSIVVIILLLLYLLEKELMESPTRKKKTGSKARK